MDAVRLTGGCQCGAVRYAAHERPRNAHICHCRMCQKAFGSFFAPLANVARDRFEVTRGEIAVFQSSESVARGFCRDCGTPLTFAYEDSPHINIALGSLDDPAAVKPEIQYGIEARMPWFAELPALPGDKTTEEDIPAERLAAIKASNRQHPDHDTEAWPAPGARRG